MPKTRLQVQTEVLYRLGDTAQDIWSSAEVQSSMQEGYDLLCLLSAVLWSRSWLDDVAGQGTYTLPTDLLEIERATWDTVRLIPLRNPELQDMDGQYETTQGAVEYYAMDGDGLRILRKYRVPSATVAYVAASVVGTWGAPRTFHEITDDGTSGTWGLPRSIPGQTVVGTWGIARRAFTVSPDTNTRIEYSRRGAALIADGTEFEVPDWVVKTIRFYCLWRALERNGPGQDLALAAHYRDRWLEGVERLKGRISKKLASRVGVMGGTGETKTRHMHGVLPWNFGRIVR